MSERLCFVEDDQTISSLIGKKLSSLGYGVDRFEAAESIWQDDFVRWDLFIIDIMLKGERNGRELCEQIRRKTSTTPILILSALSEPSDRIDGLKSGADDYLIKPFETEELILRVKGMLRRRSWYGQWPRHESTFQWEENEIDFANLSGRHAGRAFNLSQKEAMLMKLLVEHEGEVVNRSEILDKVWGYHVFPSHRTVDNFILRLRKFFEPDPKTPKYIHSVRGLGYKFSR